MSVTQAQGDIRALMLPLQASYLLLPQTAVADISFHYEKLKDRSGKPGWFQGNLYWHGTNIPVISYEKLNGNEYESGSYKEKIAICNLLDASESYPAVGILVKAVPRMAQIQRGELVTLKGEKRDEFSLSHVQFQGESMVIPDLDKISLEIDRAL